MQKKINDKRLVELIKIFKGIHISSSRTTRFSNWFKIKPFDVDEKFDNSYNEAFMMEIKPLLISLEKKENLSSIKTFLFDDERNLEDSMDNIEYTLDLKAYLNIIEKTLELVIEIKDIKLVKNYQYPQEKNQIEEIKKERDIPKTLKKIFSKIILTHNIPELSKFLEKMTDRFEIITSEFNEMCIDLYKIRSKFGKDQGITKENKDFKNSSERSKKVCSRMVIDLLKTIHNAMIVSQITND
ncbi:5696_t:CDS:2 [Funneliformis geosporum]|nr:5696_t:CDS:2 [Funneliformis geosporum]